MAQYWQDSAGVYRQPTVINPNAGANANNARQAIWHLGRELVLECFEAEGGYRVGDDDPIDDGRYDRGAARMVTVRGVIQPKREGSIQVKQEFEGERSEGQMILHLDSHEPFNIAAAEANDDIFPDGIRLVGPDMEAADGARHHVTIVQFGGRRWKVLAIAELSEGGDAELHPAGIVYRAELGLFVDASQERRAVPELRVPDWGPE